MLQYFGQIRQCLAILLCLIAHCSYIVQQYSIHVSRTLIVDVNVLRNCDLILATQFIVLLVCGCILIAIISLLACWILFIMLIICILLIRYLLCYILLSFGFTFLLILVLLLLLLVILWSRILCIITLFTLYALQAYAEQITALNDLRIICYFALWNSLLTYIIIIG